MRQIKLIGLAMAAVLALGVAVTALASAALPEFDGPFPTHFVATQLGAGELNTVGGRDIKCSGGSALGFIDGPKDVLVSGGIIYKGCESTKFGGKKCQNTATEGEIKTNPLLGLLGYVTKPNVGLLFEPSGAANFATFKCKTILTEESLSVRGTVICPLSAVNTKTEKFVLTCKQTKGVQEPLSFEGAATKDTLETEGSGLENFAFEQSGVSATSDILTLTLSLILG
jgi:hypothetical protein